MSHASPFPEIHVLTITPFYPHAADEVDGSFVAEPLPYLSRFNVISSVMALKPVSRLTFTPSAQAVEALWMRHLQLPGRAAYPSWGFMQYARLSRVVRRLHRKRKIDIIHAQTGMPCGHTAALLARDLKIPFVVTTHGLDAFSSRREKGLIRWCCQRVSRFVYSSADQNICVSHAVSREIEKVMRERARTTVIYNGVDTELFTPPLEPVNGLNKTILCVGRLVPDKGQELVLRAMARLAVKHRELRCEFVDDGPDQARLERLAKELNISDRITFSGRISRRAVAERMKQCAVFALPSRDEALGCVYLEAMATARPVIACRGQGIEEIIRHGENGWLIQPDDVEQLTAALAIFLEDDRLCEQVGAEARKTVVESLTFAHQAARLNEIYRQSIERYSRTRYIRVH